VQQFSDKDLNLF